MPLPDRISLVFAGGSTVTGEALPDTTLLFTGGRGPAGDGGGGGSSFLTVSEVDRTGETYWYYGGLDANDDWCIQRYDITQNPTERTTATNTNNSGVASLSAAWSGRGALTYA